MGEFPQRFVGQAGFEYEPVEIDRVIRRSETDLVVEFSADGWLYTVNLNSGDGIHYSGEYTARKGREIEKGHVTAGLYSAGAQRMLFGRWHEGGNGYWWVQLEPVENFE
jgi:hypothetical protein